MRHSEDRIWRSFEEFEREELRRMECVGSSVEDMIDTLFGEELELADGGSRGRLGDDED